MKKSIFLSGLAVILSLLLTGCVNNAQVSEKLCRIEIANAEKQNDVTVLESQRQSDVSEFFDEKNWTEAAENSGTLTPQYVISLYQQKTPTGIKA